MDIALYRNDEHDSEKDNAPVFNGTHIPFDIKGKQVVLARLMYYSQEKRRMEQLLMRLWMLTGQKDTSDSN